MKKFLMTVAAMMMIFSCTKKEDLLKEQEKGNGAVGVKTEVSNGTRGVALNSNTDLIASQNGFDLYAYQSDGNLFMGAVTDGVEFQYENGWDYADAGEVAFWQQVAEGNTVDFYAVSPANLYNTGFGTPSIGYDYENGAQTIEYIVPPVSEDQKDLMYARTENVDPTDINVINNGVQLDFYHALSQIVFSARVHDEDLNHITATVTGVDIVNLYGSGVFTFKNAPYGEYGDATEYTPWTYNEEQNNIYTAEVSTEGVEINTALDGVTAELTNSETALLLLPQEITGAQMNEYGQPIDNGTYIKVTCKVYYQGNNGVQTQIIGENDEAAEIYIPLSSVWKAGYKYVYTLIFSKDIADPITINEELSVAEWYDGGDTDVPGEDDEDDNGNDEQNLLLNMNAADMFVGDEIEVRQVNTRNGAALTLTSGDENIAEITVEGRIFAKGQGRTTVYVDCEGFGQAEVEINVLPTILPVTLTNPINTVNIQAGSYTMGIDYDIEPEHLADAPTHRVSVEAFNMGQYEVTVGQFVEFINANTEALKIMETYEWEGNIYNEKAVVYSYIKDGEEVYNALCELDINNISGSTVGSLSVSDEYKDYPILCSWEGAAAFAKSVGGYLPHEEEWEYAARGGVSGEIWWINNQNDLGQNFSIEDDWLKFDESISFETNEEKIEAYNSAKDKILECENLPYEYKKMNVTYVYVDDEMQLEPEYEILDEMSTSTLKPIGSMQFANPWGLYDVLGNIQEWCGNYDYDYLEGIPDEVNHIVRGSVPSLEYTIEYQTIISSYEDSEESTTSSGLWLGIAVHNFLGVAFRNVNTDMNETGFRVAFSSDYSGTNQSVQVR